MGQGKRDEAEKMKKLVSDQAEELKALGLNDNSIETIISFIEIKGTVDEMLEKLSTLNIESEFTKECVIMHGISDLLL